MKNYNEFIDFEAVMLFLNKLIFLLYIIIINIFYFTFLFELLIKKNDKDILNYIIDNN